MRQFRVIALALSSLGLTFCAFGAYFMNHAAQDSSQLKPDQVKNSVRPTSMPTQTKQQLTPARLQPLNLQHLNQDLNHNIYYRNEVVVATFHDISPTVYSRWVITPQAFSADLNAIHNHFNVITNQQFINFLSNHGSIPPNAVLLTFDDGYKDMYTYALPILVQNEMQGTFFDIVGNADKQTPNEFLSWSQIKTMNRDGMSLESHTYDEHYNVTGVSGRKTPVFNTRIVVRGHLETPQQYYNRVYSDFYRARTELSKATGQPVTEFAFPYGYGTWTSTNIARKAGYAYLFTTAQGTVTAGSNPLYIHRIDVGESTVTPEKVVQDILNAATWRTAHHNHSGHTHGAVNGRHGSSKSGGVKETVKANSKLSSQASTL